MNNKLIKNHRMFKVVMLTSLMLVQPITYTSAAFTPAIMDSANNQLLADMESDIHKGYDLASEDCSNPDNEGSLASRQAEILEQKKTLGTKPMDMSKLFEIGKNKGCFTALSQFPDLSLSIPSLADILTSLQKTLAAYAVRKVCNAVNDAAEQALSPISDKIDELSSSGQLDLSGRANKALTKKMYEVDPEMGRVSTSAQAGTTIDFEW